MTVNNRKYKEIQHSLCSVLTHFVDFYIKLYAATMDGREHIFFLATTGGQGAAAPGHPAGADHA